MTPTNICRILAVVFLAAMATHRYATLRRGGSAEPYNARVRAAAAAVPARIGGWVGADAPVPARTEEVLRPNVIITRRYLNVEDGTRVGFLLVHCADSHHMAGHFPLRCYPAQGWTLRSQRERDWPVGDLKDFKLTGTEYEFTMEAPGRSKSIVVANCIILPNNRMVRDMNGMAKAVAGVGGRSSGAGQLQVYFEDDVSPQQRDEAIKTLLAGYKGVIDAMMSSASQ